MGSPDENAHNANGRAIIKPDPHGAAAALPPVAHPIDDDSDVEIIVKPEAAVEVVPPDVDMADDVAPPALAPNGGGGDPGGDDGGGNDDDDGDSDDDFDADDVAAMAELREPAPEPAGVEPGVAARMPALPAVELKAPLAVQLPDDPVAVQRYTERALTGFAHFLFDVPQVCYYVARELGVAPKGCGFISSCCATSHGAMPVRRAGV